MKEMCRGLQGYTVERPGSIKVGNVHFEKQSVGWSWLIAVYQYICTQDLLPLCLGVLILRPILSPLLDYSLAVHSWHKFHIWYWIYSLHFFFFFILLTLFWHLTVSWKELVQSVWPWRPSLYWLHPNLLVLSPPAFFLESWLQPRQPACYSQSTNFHASVLFILTDLFLRWPSLCLHH